MRRGGESWTSEAVVGYSGVGEGEVWVVTAAHASVVQLAPALMSCGIKAMGKSGCVGVRRDWGEMVHANSLCVPDGRCGPRVQRPGSTVPGYGHVRLWACARMRGGGGERGGEVGAVWGAASRVSRTWRALTSFNLGNRRLPCLHGLHRCRGMLQQPVHAPGPPWMSGCKHRMEWGNAQGMHFMLCL